jgi:Holliday junction resolvase RusA-like endonuclease
MSYYSITPIGKPRMTRSDRWKQRPAVLRYRAFCDELRLRHPGPLSNKVYLRFYMPMPKSWSNKKQLEMCGLPHRSKPDIDNLIKSVFDALCEDDSHIDTVIAVKTWSYTPGIAIVNN